MEKNTAPNDMDKLAIPVANQKQRRPSAVSLSGIVPLAASVELRDMPAVNPTVPGSAAPVPIKAILHDDPKIKNKKKTTAAQTGASSSTNKGKDGTKPVMLFAHLSQFSRERDVMASSNIHPVVVRFALRSADYDNLGGSRRCKEMLLAFKEAIRDYRANPDMAICRHLDQYLKPMIGFMVDARPMAISMANAIRAIRYQISILPLETSEHEAQEHMYAFIDNLLSNRLEMASRLIVQHVLVKISDGDVIMTYARSSLVRDLLVEAHRQGRKFRVIVVDSRPFQEGLVLLEDLVSAGVECSYVHINAVGYMIKEVTKTIVGATGIYANGTVLNRVGTAAVCALSRRAEIPVIVCCETIKFSERSQIDSFVFNEIGDPDSLVKTQHHEKDPSLPVSLAGWREVPALKLLNILYDITPAEYVTVVITEIGLIPITSIPVVLREYSASTIVGQAAHPTPLTVVT